VNFRKFQKVAEVIHDIQRWQSKPHNFQPITPVLASLEQSLHVTDQTDVGDLFWDISLELEPCEREDERMARLLEESGFLL
jgi:son of sevenless-like protein